VANTRRAPAPPKPASAEKGDAVSIGCRLVNGVRLRSFVSVNDADTGLNRFQEDASILLRGTGAAADASLFWDERGGAVAITPLVPRTFWESWCVANADSPLLKQGIIYEIAAE